VNGLDPEGVRWMRTMLKDLAADGHTVFVSSHLMSEMAQTATRLVVIGRGRLIADTTVDEFIAQASHQGWSDPDQQPARSSAFFLTWLTAFLARRYTRGQYDRSALSAC
jgi:ABC-type multidrug transport system ATPase subunit